MGAQKGLVGLPTDKKRTALGTCEVSQGGSFVWMISITTRFVLS